MSNQNVPLTQDQFAENIRTDMKCSVYSMQALLNTKPAFDAVVESLYVTYLNNYNRVQNEAAEKAKQTSLLEELQPKENGHAIH